MKNFLIFLVIVFSTAEIGWCQSKQKVNDPSGKWVFETPYAAEGYQKGMLEIRKAGDTFNAALSFTDTVNKININNVNYIDGNVDFVLLLEGQSLNISLRYAYPDTLSGRAFTPEGELPLAMFRKKE